MTALASATTIPGSGADGRCRIGDARPGEVVIWHALGFDADEVFDDMIAEYNATHQTQIVAVDKPGYEKLADEFATVPDDQLPDVILANEASIAGLHDGGATVPITACRPDAPDLLPVIAATYTVDDELVAMPYNVSTPVLIYNAATVRAAGLDPDDPPTTPEELRAASDAVVASGAAPYGLIIHEGVGGWLLRQWAAQRDQVILDPDNGRGAAGDLVPRFATPEALEAFRWLQDGVADGSFLWVGETPSGFEDLRRLVPIEDGRTGAFTLHTSASVGGLIALLESGQFAGAELGVAPLPGPGAGGLVGGGAFWLVQTGDPDQVGAAWSVVEWLTDPEQLGRLVAATGYVPISTAVAEHPLVVAAFAEHPQLRVATDQLAATPATVATAGALSPSLLALDEIMVDATVHVVAGEDVATVLTNAEAFYGRFLVTE